MKSSMVMSESRVLILSVLLLCCFQIHDVACDHHDYKQALTNSLLYFEGQRSGKLPPNQRVAWRADSALKDGQDAGVIYLILPFQFYFILISNFFY